VAVLVLGERAAWTSLPGGCSLAVTPILVLPGGADVGGKATLTVPVPALVGSASWLGQCVGLASGRPGLWLSETNFLYWR
jgi:hypothetical protein